MAKFIVAFALLALATTAHASTVVDLISGNSQLTTFAGLLKLSGLDNTLEGSGPFTVFAPNNDAFSTIPAYRIAFLKDPANLAELQGLIKYTVATGSLKVSALFNGEKLPTLQGSDLYAAYIGNTTTVGLASGTCEKDVAFLGDEQAADNGMVQVIGTVMVPPGVFCPDTLFWVEQRGNSRIGYTGFDCRAHGTTVLTANQVKPVGVAVHSESQQVFWSDDENAKPYDSWLSTTDFTGSKVSVFLEEMYDPQGMEVDQKNAKLYYTEHQGARVQRCNLDGTDVETVLSTDPKAWFPADVAVDAEEELVFITIQSVPQVLEGKIAVMYTNGTGYRELLHGLVQNYGLCLDTHLKHLYYVQGGHGGSISCMAYGSTPCALGKNGIVKTGLNYPYMCTIDTLYTPYGGPTQVIFSETNVPGSVYVMDANGANMRAVNSQLNSPMGVTLGCNKRAN